MHKLIVWSEKHPLPVLSVVCMISIIAVLGLLRIEIDSSPKEMMIEGDPAIAQHARTIETFGTDNITIIQVDDPNLFTPDKLARLEALAYDLEGLPGVLRVESLFSVTNIRSANGFLETNPLIDYLPETKEEADAIREAALANPILLKDIVSEDGRTTAINLFVEPDPAEKQFYMRFSEAVDTAVQPFKDDFEGIGQLGMAYTQRRIVENLLKDQRTLVPLSVGVLFLLLVVTTRSKCGALLPMITGGASILWTVGFMGFVGIPINILTVIVPSLLIVVGATEDIHMLSEYLEGYEKKGTRGLAISYMANKVGTAVMLTGVTTFLGFASIAFNQISMLKQFGVAAAFGLLINPVVTCTLVPIVLRWFGPLTRKDADRSAPSPGSGLDVRIAAWILRLVRTHKNMVIVAMVGIVCVMGAFATRIQINNDMLGFFKESSDIRGRSTRLHEALAGGQSFNIHIKSDHAGAFMEPERLRKVEEVGRYLRKSGDFDNCISLADHLSLIHREMNQGNEAMYHVPGAADLIAQYLLFLHDDDISRYVNHDRSEANILVRHNLNGSHALKEALGELTVFLDDTLQLRGDYDITGEGININNAADSMAEGQAVSLIFLVVIVLVLMSVLFVNIKAGLLSVIPNIFPIVVNFGIMGIFGIPLNPGTAMVSAVSIGIAVDDTIHLMTRYNKEMRTLQDRDKAIEASLRSEIKPVLSTSIALSLGFFVLSFSSFLPVIHFGVLSGLVMLVAMASDLLFTPTLFCQTQIITLWDVLDLRLRNEVVRRSPLFVGLRPFQIKKVVLLGRVDECGAGENLFNEGEYGNSMFLILEGRGRVSRVNAETGEEMSMAEFGPGDVVGEIALVEAGPRSAGVHVVEDMKYIEIDWEGLKRIRTVYPWLSSCLFLNLSRILGGRLVATNKKLQELGAHMEES